MLLGILGSLEVEGADGPVSVGGPVPRRILCALLVRPGDVVPVDRLIDAAWREQAPPSAERTLVSHLTRLREALARAGGSGAPRLARERGGYRLVVAPEAVDAFRFEQTLLTAESLTAVEAIAALRDALALWRPAGPYADLQGTAYQLPKLRG